MCYSTITGVKTVPKSYVHAARIMGCNPVQMVYRILVPGAMTSLIPALRLSIGYCWRALVGAEMFAAMIEKGLGKMIYEARYWNDIPAMFVGLITIGAVALLIDSTVLNWIQINTVEKWGMVTTDDN